MRALPSFAVLAANYPTKEAVPPRELLTKIGGEVRSSLTDAANTCAVRVSWALNKSNAPIHATPGLYILEGAKPKPGPPLPFAPATRADRYLVRVGDVKRYLARHYGHGVLIYDARREPNRVNMRGRKRQGIILFEWLGPINDFGATGHVDLFRVVDQGPDKIPQFLSVCTGQCHWWPNKGPMLAHLWETQP